jgi:hypothetical protein
MVTDTGGINDKSFNQSAWEGMQEAQAAQTAAQKNPTDKFATFGGQELPILLNYAFDYRGGGVSGRLREIRAPFLAAPPAGARVRTRLRVSARDAVVL